MPLAPEQRLIQVEYFRDLARILKSARLTLNPLLDELPQLAKSAALDRRDIGEGHTAAQLIEQARIAFEQSFSISNLEFYMETVEKHGRKTSAAQLRALRRQTKAALGVDIFIPETGVPAMLDGFIAENVSLIKSIPEKMFSDIESIVTRGFQRGTLTRDMAKEIQGVHKTTRRRAQLVARDQIASLNGQINQKRQQNIGVKEYIWRTSRDDRVRPLHANREGDKFKWSDAPSDGHPGEPVNCRCTAEPVLSF